MPDREDLITQLSLDEKASLTAGFDLWNITGVERLGIPPIRVTDGPNGARGSGLLGAGDVTAACLPCGSALGATWDPTIVEEVGSVIGREARTKSCRFLLAPTINLHRSPLGGRNFECYSEDPLLSGQDRRRVRAGRPVPGRGGHREALRGQRRRVRAQHDELRRRRALAARALPATLRAGGHRGRGPRGHDRVQPAERHVLHRGRRAAHHHPPRGMGVRRHRHDRLVRVRRHRGLRRRGARPRDARSGPGRTGRRWPRPCARDGCPRRSSMRSSADG